MRRGGVTRHAPGEGDDDQRGEGDRARPGAGSRGRQARAAAPGLDGGLAGGASRAVARRPRTSAGRAPTARGAGRRVRSSATSASTARPTGRPARRTRTISPPSASTAGIIASSEPPVVRMSSTSRTRSPGLISKPAPELAPRAVVGRDLLGEDRPRPQLAPGLEREDHAAGRRARDEVDVGRPVLAAVDPGPERAQLARRIGVLEDLELLEVGLAVAAALEHEVPLAERAAAAEQGLGALGDGAPCRIADRSSEGRH